MKEEELAGLCRSLRRGETEAAAAAVEAADGPSSLRLFLTAAASGRSQDCFAALLKQSAGSMEQFLTAGTADAASLASALLYLAFDRRFSEVYGTVMKLFEKYLLALAQREDNAVFAPLFEAAALAAALARRAWQPETALLNKMLCRFLLRAAKEELTAAYLQELTGQLAQLSAYHGLQSALGLYKEASLFCLLLYSRCRRSDLSFSLRQRTLTRVLAFVRDAAGAAARACLMEEGEALAEWCAFLGRLCEENGLKAKRAELFSALLVAYYSRTKPKSFSQLRQQLPPLLLELPVPYDSLLADCT